MNPNVVASFALIGRLRDRGITHCVISPGSRSTPLAYAAHTLLESVVVIDERDAGFLALGISESNNRATVLITTSGSAPTHLYPSIVEAFQSNIGLIVLSADRPHEVRGRGAPQTINQINLYSNSVRFFNDAQLPHENSDEQYWQSLADELFIHSDMSAKVSGPIQLNVGFKEPLVPEGDEVVPAINLMDNSDLKVSAPTQPRAAGFLSADISYDQKKISSFINTDDKVLITLGRFYSGAKENLYKFADSISAPILADVLSNERCNEKVISTYDAIVRQGADELIPDVIIEIGEPLTSKAFNATYGNQSKVISVSLKEDERNPHGHHDVSLVVASYDDFFDSNVVETRSSEYKDLWEIENIKAIELINSLVESHPDSEPAIMATIGDSLVALDTELSLLLGSSMPVRYAEWFWHNVSKNVHIYSHRGTNGIDGMISSATGVGIGSNKATLCVLGDVTFSHDLGFLPHAQQLSEKLQLKLVFVVIDNEGGVIFSHLDQGKSEVLKKSYNELFNTNSGLDIGALVQASHAQYLLANNNNVKELIENCLKDVEHGVTVIHIKCDPKSGPMFMEELNKKLKQ